MTGKRHLQMHWGCSGHRRQRFRRSLMKKISKKRKKLNQAGPATGLAKEPGAAFIHAMSYVELGRYFTSIEAWKIEFDPCRIVGRQRSFVRFKSINESSL